MRSHPRPSSLRWLLLIGLTCGLAAFALRAPQPARASSAAGTLALVNAASYTSTVAPGSIAALFAADMTAQPDAHASTLPLPTTLAGLTVRVNGTLAPLFFASRNQVNIQVPGGVNPGTATVEVFNGGATPVSTGTVTVVASAPGIFTVNNVGTEQAAALNSDYTLNSDFDRFPGSRPEASGNFVIIYATGLGRTTPLVADGQAAPGSPLALPSGTTTVTVGGVAATVLFSGLAPGYVGLWQINVLLPASLPTNLATSMNVSLNGGQSLQATLAVANKNEFGTVAGSVVNALTGGPLGGASLTLQPTGAGQTRNATTDGQGRYSVYVISAGGYNLSASAAGFLTATQLATIAGGQSQTLSPIALTPPLVAGQYRVVLTWVAQNGVDLDAHLTGPTATNSRYHVWWNGETDLGSPVSAQFDRDDQTGAGPETVTFTVPVGGTYRFSVQNYSDRDTNGSTRLAQAGVTVRVYRGSQQLDFFTAPAGGGTLWKVFEVSNGQLQAINQLADEPDPSNIKATF